MESECEELFFRESGPFSITIVEDEDIAPHLPKDPLFEVTRIHAEEFWNDSCWSE